MIIHNATFMIEKEREADVILWLKSHLPSEGLNPRVSAMREAGGVSHEDAEAASIAYQVEFPDETAARAFNGGAFSALAEAFTQHFGNQTMIFTSLFEIV